MENLLVISNHVNDIKKISKSDLSSYKSIVVASDNYKVHIECNKFSIFDEVTFIQKPLAYTKVANNVSTIIDKVNLYLEQFTEIGPFSKKDLFWTHHVEGGFTTQRMQDTLLAIECAEIIFEKFSPDEILIFDDNWSLTFSALKRYAIKYGCKVTEYKKKFFVNKVIVKNFVRPFYFLVRSFFCKITSKKPKLPSKKNVVLFQICGSSQKHIQNALFPQKNFLENGYIPLNIIWGNTIEVKKINNSGHLAISIEWYLKYIDIFKSILKYFKTFFKIKFLKDIFHKENIFSYKGIDITDIVYESVEHYIFTNGPENFRYRIAAERFVEDYSAQIVAIKYCAAKFLSQGTILSNIFKDEYLKFDYEVGLVGPNAYVKQNSKKHFDFFHENFIKFAPNELGRKYFIEYENIDEDNAVIFGGGRSNSHFDFAKNILKSESKKQIGIEKEYDIHILFEFSGLLPGYISNEEILITLDTVVNHVKNHPNIALIIKPHPSADISPLSSIDLKGNKNIYILNKKILPNHALNISEIIISKFSYMGIEAMIYGAQVLSVHLDREKMFKIYGDSAEYVYSKNELQNFLDEKLHSKNSFTEWKKQYKEKRIEFLKEYYY